jgi:hypothetical protein
MEPHMRPLSLILALAATAAGVTAVQAQDRYSSRGVVFVPAASAQAAPDQAHAAQTAEAPLAPTRVAYVPTRLLRWPGKVAGPQPRVEAPPAAEPQAEMAPPPQAAPVAQAPVPVAFAPARQRFASINSQPSTTPIAHRTQRVEAPVQQPRVLQVQTERPAPQRLAAETPTHRPAAQAAAPQPELRRPPAPQATAPQRAPAQAPAPERAPPPQSIYSPPAPAPVAAAPAPVQTAALTSHTGGGYPPATKEPWRRLIGPTPAPRPQNITVPIGPPSQARAAAPAAPVKAAAQVKAAPQAKASAKSEKTTAQAAAAPAPAAARPAAPAAFQTVSAANTGSPTRFYSVHRQFGVQPDHITMPKQFFLDGSPDLSEPPPPPLRRIPPTSGQSTAQIRAAQARSQESPDAPAG